MKKNYYLLTAMTVSIFFAACSKSGMTDKHLQEKADGFKAYISDHGFQLKAFYADKPIDYIQNDTITAKETDLWKYTKTYLWDDRNLFLPNGKLAIIQSEVKMPGVPEDTVQLDYNVGVDNDHVGFNFIDYYYKPMRYTLESYNDTCFIISCGGPDGSKLFSRFLKVQ